MISTEQPAAPGPIHGHHLKALVEPERLKELSQLNSLRVVSRVVIEFLVIFGVIAFTHRHWHPLLYLFSLLVIGTRQHALAVLIHEGAHYRLHRNRLLNEIIGEFICNTFLISLATYRNYHFAHHRNSQLNTANDPDFRRRNLKQWTFPKTPRSLALVFMRDLFGLSTFALLREIKFNRAYRGKRSLAFKSGFLFFWAAVVACLVVTGLWKFYVIYYVVSVFTATKFILRMRAISDHYGMESRHHTRQMRDIVCSKWEKLVFFSCGSGYHGLHHYFVSVPYYNLGTLYDIVSKRPEYEGLSHSTQGISGLWRECTRTHA